MHYGDDDNDDDTKNNYFLEYERKPRKFQFHLLPF